MRSITLKLDKCNICAFGTSLISSRNAWFNRSLFFSFVSILMFSKREQCGFQCHKIYEANLMLLRLISIKALFIINISVKNDALILILYKESILSLYPAAFLSLPPGNLSPFRCFQNGISCKTEIELFVFPIFALKMVL